MELEVSFPEKTTKNPEGSVPSNTSIAEESLAPKAVTENPKSAEDFEKLDLQENSRLRDTSIYEEIKILKADKAIPLQNASESVPPENDRGQRSVTPDNDGEERSSPLREADEEFSRKFLQGLVEFKNQPERTKEMLQCYQEEFENKGEDTEAQCLLSQYQKQLVKAHEIKDLENQATLDREVDQFAETEGKLKQDLFNKGTTIKEFYGRVEALAAEISRIKTLAAEVHTAAEQLTKTKGKPKQDSPEKDNTIEQLSKKVETLAAQNCTLKCQLEETLRRYQDEFENGGEDTEALEMKDLDQRATSDRAAEQCAEKEGKPKPELFNEDNTTKQFSRGVETLAAENSTLCMELHSLQERLIEETEKNSKLVSEIDDAKQRFSQSNKSLGKELGQARKAVAEEKQRMKYLQSEYALVFTEQEKLKQTKLVLSREVDDLRIELSNKENTVEEFAKRVETLAAENSTLKSELNNFKGNADGLAPTLSEEQNLSYSEKSERISDCLRSQLLDTEDLNRDLNSSSCELSKHEQSAADLEDEKKRLTDLVEKLKYENSEQQIRIDLMDRENQILTYEKVKLNNGMNSLECELIDCKEAMERVEKENGDLKMQIAYFQQRFSAEFAEISKSSAKEEERSRQTRESLQKELRQASNASLFALLSDMESNNQTNESLPEELFEAKRVIADKIQKTKDLQSNYDFICFEQERLKEENSFVKSEAKTWQRQKDVPEAEVQRLTNENSELQNKLACVTSENKKLKEQNSNIIAGMRNDEVESQAFESLTERNASTIQDPESFQIQHEGVKTKHLMAQVCSAEIRSLEAMIQKLQQENNAVYAAATTLQQEKVDFEALIDDLWQEKNDLEAAVENLQREKDAVEMERDQMYESLKDAQNESDAGLSELSERLLAPLEENDQLYDSVDEEEAKLADSEGLASDSSEMDSPSEKARGKSEVLERPEKIFPWPYAAVAAAGAIAAAAGFFQFKK